MASIPADWAAPIIRSWKANGNFDRMAQDAIAYARLKGREEDVQRHRNLRDQFTDFVGQ